VTAAMAAVHATVSGFTTRIENLGYKLYLDNLFSSPDLCDNLYTKAINSCGTVRPNDKGMPSNFGNKPGLKQADVKTRVKSDKTAAAWKDK
jgi:hypothetical protein